MVNFVLVALIGDLIPIVPIKFACLIIMGRIAKDMVWHSYISLEERE